MRHGWNSERRQRQSEAIRRWKPWKRSTGPRTEAGKAVSRLNAFKHGCRSKEARALESRITRGQSLCSTPDSSETSGSSELSSEEKPAANVISATARVAPKYLTECDITNSVP